VEGNKGRRSSNRIARHASLFEYGQPRWRCTARPRNRFMAAIRAFAGNWHDRDENYKLRPDVDHGRFGLSGQPLDKAMLRDERAEGEGQRRPSRNVLGEPLEVCSMKPMTGFYRDGCCNTGREDIGSHTVCAVMTAAFLEFSKSRGNDLSTPLPEFNFPGLKPGDRWCLCAARWQEAFDANHAPRVVLRATHEAALSYCSLADLKRFAVDLA
jgi:uncharacterized protein